MTVDLVIEGVVHEAHDVGNHRFGPLGLDGPDNVIIGNRRVFNENFTDNTDLWLDHGTLRNRVEVMDDCRHVAFKLLETTILNVGPDPVKPVLI